MRKLTTSFFLGIILILLSCPISSAQKDTIFVANEAFVTLNDNLTWWIDSTKNKPLQEILNQEFHPNPFKAIPRITSNNIYWFKINIQNTNKNDSINRLICTEDDFQWLELYTLKDNRIDLVSKGGVLSNYETRGYKFNGRCLSLSIPPDELNTFFIKIKTFHDKVRKLKNIELITYEQETINKSIWLSKLFPTIILHAILLSIVLIATIFCLFQFYFYKDKAYLFYATYAFGIFLYYFRAMEETYSLPIFFAYHLDYFKHIEIQNGYFIYFFYLLFLYHFLDIPKFYSNLKEFFNIGICFYGFMFLINPLLQFFGSVETSIEVHDYTSVFFFLFSLYFIVILFFNKKNILARFVILGTLFLILGPFLSVLGRIYPDLETMHFFGLIRKIDTPVFPLYIYNTKIGIILEVVCFLIGLSYRSKINLEQYYIDEQKIKEAERLKKLDEFKTRFYTNITHEFRTPLTVILGMVQQIKQHGTMQLDNALEMIQRNGDNLLTLVNKLLALSKLEDNRQEVHLVNGDIVAYLKYLSDSFKFQANSSGVDFIFECDNPILIMDFDKEMLRQIISNLVSNAIKSCTKSGVIKFTIKTLSSPSDKLHIYISDTGRGIPNEHLPFIFNRFYQVNPNKGNMLSTTGVGLSLVKELVRLLQGEISVESIVGKGTIFKVMLPIKNTKDEIGTISIKDSNNQLNTSKENTSLSPNGKDKNTLLIVEDNEDIVLYLDGILSGEYNILTAKDGLTGIELALELIPDIIISDVMMPIKSGIELCQILKKDERTSHIPIILLTAKSAQKTKLEGLEHGADVWLTKPFNEQELLIRLEQLLMLRKQLQLSYANGLTLNTPLLKYEDAFIKKVKTIIEERIGDENFGTLELASSLFMSRIQLYRKLKALCNQSPSEFIRQNRLLKGKELLVQTNLPIQTIAYQTGFKEPAHFSNAFKKYFQETPSEARLKR